MDQEQGEDLLTGSDAARILGRSPRTAQVVARRRQSVGDQTLRRIGNRWVAPLDWWRQMLEEIPQRAPGGGRKRRG